MGGGWIVTDEYLSLTWGKLQLQSATPATPQSAPPTNIGVPKTPKIWGAEHLLWPINPLRIGAPIPGALHGVYLGTGRKSYGFIGSIFAEFGFGKDFMTFYRDGRVTCPIALTSASR